MALDNGGRQTRSLRGKGSKPDDPWTTSETMDLTIGPYTIVNRLGAGGMGEVLLARDERLSRSVAIKRLHSGRGDVAESRARFLREARLAARLNHPNIVQVYDVLTGDAGDETVDCIVMEYVDGKTLRDLVSRRPMPTDQALAVAEEIAAALEEAHRHGVLHRDLKSENVLITATGHAKISDFGIAKPMVDESSLTGDRVVGTVRTMSPEQACGAELDARSDLFSFGILLYEMLAGKPPFRGSNNLATMQQIIHEPHESLTGKGVEVSLSTLVDALLQKDPALRPASAEHVRLALVHLREGMGDNADEETRERMSPAPRGTRTGTQRFGRVGVAWSVAGLVALISVVSLVLLAPWASAAPVHVVVPLPLATSEASQTARAAIQDALLRSLLPLSGVAPIAPSHVDLDEASPQVLIRAFAANELLLSRLDCSAEACQLTLRRMAADQSLLWTTRISISPDELMSFDEAIAAHVHKGFSEFELRAGARRLRVEPADYQRFVALHRDFARGKPDRYDEKVLEDLQAIHQSSPQFMEAFLFAADILHERFYLSRRTEDLERARAHVGRAIALAPEALAPRLTLIDIDLAANALEPAASALDSVQRLQPGSASILARRAMLVERRGDAVGALLLQNRAVAARPAWDMWFRLANMQARLGQQRDARASLEKVLERAPGLRDALSLLGQLELMGGSLARAEHLYAALSERAPGFAEISSLGLAQMLNGNHEAAAKTFARARALEPQNPAALLNCADADKLRGHTTSAVGLYREVVSLLARHAQPLPWELQLLRAQAFAQLGRDADAVNAVQVLLRQSAGNANAAYTAAQVYALVKDRTSALVNATAAAKGGFGERWFVFPWFDDLRGENALQEVFRGSAAE